MCEVQSEGLALALLLGEALLRPPGTRGLADVATSVFVHSWVAFLPSFWIRLRQSASRGWLLAFWTAIAANDVVAYFVGSSLGRRPLAALFGRRSLPPAALVSPRKTVEGFFAGLLASAASLAGAALWAGDRQAAAAEATGGRRPSAKRPRPLRRLRLLAVGAAAGLGVGLAAVAGDLLASLVKRDARLKDSGSLLPGHGGWLDRTDACLVSAPVCVVAARVLAEAIDAFASGAAEESAGNSASLPAAAKKDATPSPAPRA